MSRESVDATLARDMNAIFLFGSAEQSDSLLSLGSCCSGVVVLSSKNRNDPFSAVVLFRWRPKY